MTDQAPTHAKPRHQAPEGHLPPWTQACHAWEEVAAWANKDLGERTSAECVFHKSLLEGDGLEEWEAVLGLYGLLVAEEGPFVTVSGALAEGKSLPYTL